MLQIVNRYIRWILLLLIGLTFLLGYAFVLERQISNVQTVARDSLPAKNKVLSDLQSIKAELDQIVIDFNNIISSKRKLVDRFDLLIPNTSQYGDLFTIIDDVSKSAGFTVSSINMSFSDGQPGLHEVSASSATSRSSFATGQIKTISIGLSVQGGSYDSFKGYLEVLERNIRLFDVESVAFSGSQFVQADGGNPAIGSYTIELKTYYMGS